MSPAASPDSGLGRGQARPAIEVRAGVGSGSVSGHRWPQREVAGDARLGQLFLRVPRTCEADALYQEGVGAVTCLHSVDLGWMLRRVDLLGLAPQESSKPTSPLSEGTDPCCLMWAAFTVTGCLYCPLTQPRVWALGGPGLTPCSTSSCSHGWAEPTSCVSPCHLLVLPHSGVPTWDSRRPRKKCDVLGGSMSLASPPRASMAMGGTRWHGAGSPSIAWSGDPPC